MTHDHVMIRDGQTFRIRWTGGTGAWQCRIHPESDRLSLHRYGLCAGQGPSLLASLRRLKREMATLDGSRPTGATA